MNDIKQLTKEYKKMRIVFAVRDLEDADYVELMGILLDEAKSRFGIDFRREVEQEDSKK